ncbi:hypothetical protein QC763_0051560 [Podospora pseudopauciseta]|uniref:Uncharacterized protein n=1 Tax=Podospora pseudopauciseta TaxID=2093780 RepID=A0ABR0HG84_9PEZI|nr:hypothetical protein QC763_0051560 [Podospora pseudopauciseta]
MRWSYREDRSAFVKSSINADVNLEDPEVWKRKPLLLKQSPTPSLQLRGRGTVEKGSHGTVPAMTEAESCLWLEQPGPLLRGSGRRALPPVQLPVGSTVCRKLYLAALASCWQLQSHYSDNHQLTAAAVLLGRVPVRTSELFH